jgi:predicted nucleic acid-binding protein
MTSPISLTTGPSPSSRVSGRGTVAVGVEIDDTPIDPLILATLRVRTGCKMPDCCVLASAATRNTAVASFDERLRRHADDDLSSAT